MAHTAIGQTPSPSRPKLQHRALSRQLRAVPLLLDLLNHEQACVQEAFDTISEAALLSAREAGRRAARDAPMGRARQRQAKRVATNARARPGELDALVPAHARQHVDLRGEVCLRLLSLDKVGKLFLYMRMPPQRSLSSRATEPVNVPEWPRQTDPPWRE